jgi:peroxiredoxin Q/BCP
MRTFLSHPRILVTPLVWILAALILGACSASPKELKVGDRAPDFRLPTADGAQVSLADYKGRQPVLLFFHMAVG